MSYFRRFRMEIDLEETRVAEPALPSGFEWLAWDASLLDRHAQVKFHSFRSEIDSQVFACLGDYLGCRRLMQEITRQDSFIPETTWLITQIGEAGSRSKTLLPVDCGTIQGLASGGVLGAVQNVGVVPTCRGLGLGRALVLKSLHGFRAAGVRRVYLEVTAENRPAVELYRSIGFRLSRTMYKAVYTEAAPSF